MPEFFTDPLSSEAGIRKVTMADLEAQVKSQFFFTARDGVYRNEMAGSDAAALSHVMICVLILHNGLKLVGVNTGSVDPRDYNADMAMKMARADAINQLWPMLGFQLKEQLYMEAEMDAMIAHASTVGEQQSAGVVHNFIEQPKQDVADLTGIQKCHNENPPL